MLCKQVYCHSETKTLLSSQSFSWMSLIGNRLNSVVTQRDVEVGEGNKFILFMRKNKNFLIMRCSRRGA